MIIKKVCLKIKSDNKRRVIINREWWYIDYGNKLREILLKSDNKSENKLR